MNSYVTCWTVHASVFGKTHSPRTCAGRSGSSTTPSFAPAPLRGLFTSSFEQGYITGRPSRVGAVGQTGPAHVTVAAVSGGQPPGSGNGGGGGRGDGGGREPSPEPGPAWWLFCIQAAAAGWAAGCVMFEAGHLLQRPGAPARSLPPSKKMVMAKKAVVEMHHDPLKMSWVWVLIAALGMFAVMISKRSDGVEHDSKDEQEETAAADDVSEEEAAAGDTVPNLAPERYSPGAHCFSTAAARTHSAPLPDLRVRANCDSSSFQDLQRFWASGGLASPLGDLDNTLAFDDDGSGSRKRAVSLDARPTTALAAPERSEENCRAASALLLDQKAQQLLASPSNDSDALSCPSTPHTPDLTGSPGSDLASLWSAIPEHASSFVATGENAEAESVHTDGSSTPTASEPAPSLLRMGQLGPEAPAHCRDGEWTFSHHSMLARDVDQVDEASAQAVDVNSNFGNPSCHNTSAGEVSCIERMPEHDSAAVAAKKAANAAKAAATSIEDDPLFGRANSSKSVGSSAADGDMKLRQSESEDEDAHEDENLGDAAAEMPAGASIASRDGAAMSGGGAEGAGHEPGAGGARQCEASDTHVQVPSELNLRPLPPKGIPFTARPNLVTDNCSAGIEPHVASPLQAVLSGYSFVRGGLDTTSSTVFPQTSWQIPDDVLAEARPSPQGPASLCNSDATSHSDLLTLPRHKSGQSNSSNESFGSSGSPSFMSFPTEQNQIRFQWT
eukprot:jgi/Ulvmu1/4817/UM020_0102.1